MKLQLVTSDIENFMEYPETFGHWLGYDKLIDIHGYWIKEAHLYHNIDSLMAHRKAYKTTAIIVVGFIWNLLFFNPNDTMLYLRKTDPDAIAISGAIRDNLEKPQTVAVAKFLYGVDTLKTSVWSASKLKLSIKTDTTPEGSIEARGLKSAKTGTHHKKIFADDFVDIDDRISKAEREKTIYYISELTNIVTDDGRIFYSGTPWHVNDAWSKLPPPIMFPMGTVPIPGYKTKEELESKRKELQASALTPSLIAANYDLKHISDDNKIFRDPIYNKWPDRLKLINAWLDTAYDGFCTTSLSMVGLDINHIPYVRGWVWHENVVDVYQSIVDKLVKYKCGTLYVEDNADKGAATRDLRKLYPAVVGRNEHMNKHIKIISYLKPIFQTLNFADDCQPEYMNQLLDYTEDADLVDAADSLSALSKEMKLKGTKISILDRF